MASSQTPTPAPKYSTGQTSIGQASKFSWEHAIPDTPFWNTLEYSTSANFRKNFTAEELSRIHFDDSLPFKTKLLFLENLLREKLAEDEEKAAPKTLYDVDFKNWDRLWLAIACIQGGLGNRDEKEGILRMLLEKREDKANLSHMHNMSGMLLMNGKYAKAEELAQQVVPWLDSKLGRDSPQAIGSRRILAQAIWKQGRVEEGRELIEEIFGYIEESGHGKYAVYQDGEREELTRVLEELEKEK